MPSARHPTPPPNTFAARQHAPDVRPDARNRRADERHARVIGGDEQVRHLVRLVAGAGRCLHERIRGMPHRDEVAERQRAEAVAEIGVVDQELRGERVNLHVIHSKQGVADVGRMLPIGEWKGL